MVLIIRAAMTNKLRILLTLALVLTAWGIGFSMGGGLRVKDVASAGISRGDEKGELSSEDARRRVGQVMAAIPDGSEEAGRRVAWTRESFKRAAANFGKEGNLISYARRAMQMTDSLNMEDFPMVVEAFAEVKAEGKNELDGIMELLIAGRWAELNPKAAAEFLKQRGGINYMDMNPDIVWSVWAEKDPAAAAAYAKQSGDPRAMKTILESLAMSDVDNALAFARIHAPELIADGSLSSALGKKSKFTDPERVAKQLESLGSFDGNTTLAMSGCAEQWAKKDRNAARNWALSLPDAEARKQALFGVYKEWSSTDPKAAADALLAEPRNGADFENVAAFVASSWSRKDWKGAADWMEKLPSEKEKSVAAASLSFWLGQDNPANGAEFLKGLPSGAVRDAATDGYVRSIRSENIGSAMEWAFTISDAKKRSSTTKTVLKEWFNEDPAAAYQWLETDSGMTPEQRADFLRK